MMKIIFFAKNFFYPGRTKGGMEKYLYNLVLKLRERHEIVIILPNRYNIKIEGVKIYHFLEIPLPLLSLFTVFMSLSLLAPIIIHKEKPHLISAFIPSFSSSILFFWAKILHVPSVINLRGIWEKSQILLRILSTPTFLFSSAIIANAENFFLGYQKTLFMSSKKYQSIPKYFIPNAVNFDFWNKLEKPKEKQFDILYVGNLHQKIRIIKKGFITFYKAIEILQKNNSMRLKVGIIGKYSDQILSSMIPNFNPNLMTFLGFFTNNKKMRKIMHSTSIYVLTSNIEGMPNSLMEAMATGRACIATNVGSVSNLITSGKDGYVVKKGDFRAIIDRVQFLLDSPHDRESIGSRALISMKKKFSWKSNIQAVLAIYQKIIKEH